MWTFEGDKTLEDIDVEKKLTKFFQNDVVAKGFSRFWSLYKYLLKNPPTNPRVLRANVWMDKAHVIPFFDEETSKKVVVMWKIVHDPTKFSKFLAQRFKAIKKGGATSAKNEEVLDKTIDYVVQKADDTAQAVGLIPGNPGVLGKVASVGSYGRWVLTLPTKILTWVMEKPWLGGPVWTVAIDLFLKLVPKFILLIDVVAPIIAIPLMPLGIGFVVEAFAFALATFLGLITVFLSLATGRIGSAFLNFLQLIPFVGPFLRLGVVNIVDTYTSVEEELPRLGQLPVIGPLIYTEPAKEQTTSTNVTGGRTRRRTGRYRRSRKHSS